MVQLVLAGILLQSAMVAIGHVSESVLNLSGILGTAIPFVLGIGLGMSAPGGYAIAAKGGFVIGIVGAVIGVVAAILLGDQTWILLTFAPLSSGITGALGGLLGTLMGGPGGKKRRR